VLLVEDDVDSRLAVSRYLRAAGLKVRAVANGKEALKAVDEEAPDAVILDLMTPVMDGFTFLDRLRAMPYHSGLPVIVLTDRDLSSDEWEDLREKASSVVEKGENIEERLREVLGAFLPLQR
jgi:CheY-like chemotaxis protein